VELLFVVLIAATIGIAVRALVRGTDTFGMMLLPAVSTVAASIVWVALLWLGWTFDGTWIWVASFVIGGLTTHGRHRVVRSARWPKSVVRLSSFALWAVTLRARGCRGVKAVGASRL
jgi:hypothetical protein